MASRKILAASHHAYLRPSHPSSIRSFHRGIVGLGCGWKNLSWDFSYGANFIRAPSVHRHETARKPGPGRGLSFNDRMVLRAIRADEVQFCVWPLSRDFQRYECHYWTLLLSFAVHLSFIVVSRFYRLAWEIILQLRWDKYYVISWFL